MSDEIKKENEEIEETEEFDEVSEDGEEIGEEIYTLTDEEGNETQFELAGIRELDGQTYYALIPLDNENDEYVILKSETGDDGEEMLVTIDDDDEFNKIADIFDGEIFNTIDYDE